MDQLHLGLAPALALIKLGELERCLYATRLLLALWCAVSSLEWFSNRAVFRSDGLLSWHLLSLRSDLVYRLRLPAWLFSEVPVVCLLAVRIVAALLLALPAVPPIVPLIVIIATSIVLKLRTWLGEDGADQMSQIVAIGALAMASGIALSDNGLALAGVVLVAGQLTISYFFAGFAKLRSAEWRRGQAIVGVMGTHSYGHGAAAALVGRSAFAAVALCWLVMVPEALFPAALLAPPAICWCALAIFAAFHIATALFMGLNTFVWAFLAAYPSTILLNLAVSRAIGWV